MCHMTRHKTSCSFEVLATHSICGHPPTMSQIPRQVHVIWIQGEAHLLRTRDWWVGRKAAWGEWMPKWTLRVWSDTEIRHVFQGSTVYAPLLRMYDAPNAPMAWKADVARYVLLHKYGGMYADITYEVIRNFDWMLHGKGVDFVCLHNDLQTVEKDLLHRTNNCWFAATAGHPILTALLQRLVTEEVPATFTIGDIHNLTGPIQLWRAVKPYLASPRVRAIPSVALDPSITSLSYKPCASADACRAALPCAVAIHHTQLSYGTAIDRFGFHIFQHVRRNSLPLLLLFILLLALVVAVSVAVTWSLARKFHRCQQSCGLTPH